MGEQLGRASRGTKPEKCDHSKFGSAPSAMKRDTDPATVRLGPGTGMATGNYQFLRTAKGWKIVRRGSEPAAPRSVAGLECSATLFGLLADNKSKTSSTHQCKLDLDGKVIQAGEFDNKASQEEQDKLLENLFGAPADNNEKDEVDESGGKPAKKKKPFGGVEADGPRRKKGRHEDEDLSIHLSRRRAIQKACSVVLAAIEAAEVADEEDEEGNMISRRRAEIFATLPDRELYPDYYDIIHDPMALDIIKDRVNNLRYGSLAAFKADIIQIFNNARTYNLEGSQVYEDAQELQRVATTLFNIVAPQGEPPITKEEADEAALEMVGAGALGGNAGSPPRPPSAQAGGLDSLLAQAGSAYLPSAQDGGAPTGFPRLKIKLGGNTGSGATQGLPYGDVEMPDGF
ncbi:hypothetical protein SeLEV6574_g01949 [Synchytrium endobioticum]|uniref:Bromo domain-containing protein n=1 Tax=Synchytrium endobioticum TaxID=286115 RepID=A0A507DAK3_9FUNG|nr:hypothetical protein SeLEV6574_g01949 [Synchytrium endobioticum]